MEDPLDIQGALPSIESLGVIDDLAHSGTGKSVRGYSFSGVMSNYRRLYRGGGSYFFTHVTYQRYPWLCSDLGRQALREAITTIRAKYPFTIDAFVLLPDHFHCSNSHFGKLAVCPEPAEG